MNSSVHLINFKYDINPGNPSTQLGFRPSIYGLPQEQTFQELQLRMVEPLFGPRPRAHAETAPGGQKHQVVGRGAPVSATHRPHGRTNYEVKIERWMFLQTIT